MQRILDHLKGLKHPDASESTRKVQLEPMKSLSSRNSQTTRCHSCVHVEVISGASNDKIEGEFDDTISPRGKKEYNTIFRSGSLGIKGTKSVPPLSKPTPSVGRVLEIIPNEILIDIATLLCPMDRACLAFTSRHTHRVIGKALNLRPSRDRYDFLHRLEKTECG